MKRIGVVILSAIFTCNVIANTQTTQELTDKTRINDAIAAKLGIEFSNYNEINIISADKYLNNLNPSNANDVFMANEMKKYLAMHQEQQDKGYVEEKEPRAKELLDFKNLSSYQKNKYKDVLSSESTHLRDSIRELKLAYTFLGVPTEDMDSNYGVAPYGAYKSIKKGDIGDGWDGAVQFFDKKGIGGCAFSEHNRKLSGFGVELIKELVSYEIQNRPTVLLVTGTKESGYVYKLKWYDPTFSRELECANMEFHPQIKEKVIELANHIESYQHP